MRTIRRGNIVAPIGELHAQFIRHHREVTGCVLELDQVHVVQHVPHISPVNMSLSLPGHAAFIKLKYYQNATL